MRLEGQSLALGCGVWRVEAMGPEPRAGIWCVEIMGPESRNGATEMCTVLSIRTNKECRPS